MFNYSLVSCQVIWLDSKLPSELSISELSHGEVSAYVRERIVQKKLSGSEPVMSMTNCQVVGCTVLIGTISLAGELSVVELSANLSSAKFRSQKNLENDFLT